MEVLILLIFLSVMLVGGALGLFAWTVRERTFDHSDRLALLPLRDAEIAPGGKTDAAGAPDTPSIPRKGDGTDGEKGTPR